MLNTFQKKCEESINQACSRMDVEQPIIKKVTGRTEYYIAGQIGQCKFWIYEEGAEFLVGDERKDDKNRWIFEIQDYDSEDELIAELISDFSENCA